MQKTPAVQLRKQRIEDRLTDIVESKKADTDRAFVIYASAIIFGLEFDDLGIDADIVDGGDDKGFDVIHVEEHSDEVYLYLLQIKNAAKFSGTSILQMRDGFSWLFSKPESKYKKINNRDLVVRIGEIREIAKRFGHRNLHIRMHYIAKGDSSRLSPDFKAEVQATVDAYVNEFGSFEFHVFGINELIDREDVINSATIKINADLPICWNVNTRSVIEYQAGKVRALICSVKATDLAKLVSDHSRTIFEENVRTFFGVKGKVNPEIRKTASSDEQADYFWFYNNGITVTCEKFDLIYSSTPAIVRIEGMQIVNGCQTSMTLADAFDKSDLKYNVIVLMKIYETKDSTFADKITQTTNSQNAVSSRDLHSNDSRQKDLEALFSKRGYYYERKPRQYSTLTRQQRRQLVSNEKAGQAILAMVFHKPAAAMAQKSRVWVDYYDRIFEFEFERILAAHMLYQYCVEYNAEMRKRNEDSIDAAISKYGHFHLVRIVASYQLGESWETMSLDRINELIASITKRDSRLARDFMKARNLLNRALSDLVEGDMSTVLTTFKSTNIETKIEELLKRGVADSSEQNAIV